ncbi:MAG: MFS transporter [Caldilineaceae bacterium SB0668_bin_21]|nr:MFS transporter [Caldilineaceae bacterium SB0668_bin_21]MYC22134.1 MFS transporter [Caldilineaceae bacterium SB0662_bin_25]
MGRVVGDKAFHVPLGTSGPLTFRGCLSSSGLMLQSADTHYFRSAGCLLALGSNSRDHTGKDFSMSATVDRPADPATDQVEPSESKEFQTREVLTIVSGHFVHDIFTAFVPPLLPLIRERLAADYAAIGGLAVFMQIPSLLQPFIGHAADRISLRYFIILAPAVTATVCSLLGLANSYVLLALLLFVAGLSSAVFHAPAPAMIGRISGNRVGTGMSFFMAAGELGRTVGPLLVIAAVSWFGLEGIWRVAVFGWMASVFLFWRLRGVSARPAPDRLLSLQQMLPAARKVYPPLLWIMAARVFMSISMTTYLPIFMQDVKGYEFEIAGLSLTLLEGAGVLGALTMGTASDWLGRRRILIVLFMVSPILFLGFLNSSGWLLFAFLLPLGFTMLSPSAVLLAVVQDSFQQNRALANGLFLMANFVIRSPALWLLGSVADRFGLESAFLMSGLIAFVGVPAILRLPERRRENGE